MRIQELQCRPTAIGQKQHQQSAHPYCIDIVLHTVLYCLHEDSQISDKASVIVGNVPALAAGAAVVVVAAAYRGIARRLECALWQVVRYPSRYLPKYPSSDPSYLPFFCHSAILPPTYVLITYDPHIGRSCLVGSASGRRQSPNPLQFQLHCISNPKLSSQPFLVFGGMDHGRSG